MFTVAIIGRPNVGKSTLFNRLVGKKLALVDDRPGVTRDRREGEARLGDLRFTIVDTAGLEEGDAASLSGRTRAQTEAAILAADAIFFVVDARVGLTPDDRAFAALVRRAGKPLILIANKAEGRAGGDGAMEAYQLGLGDPVALSAEHGDGMAELYSSLLEALPEQTAAPEDEEAEAPKKFDDEEDGSELDVTKPLRIAVVGRPNAGKSTLLNQILGENRLLTGPEAGLTRDAIGVDLVWRGRQLKMFDTAGLRRRARVEDKLEKLAGADALRAAKFAEVVILLVDATKPFEKQDLTLADLVVREGRAIVIGLNKWDLVTDKAGELNRLRAEGLAPAAADEGRPGGAARRRDRLRRGAPDGGGDGCRADLEQAHRHRAPQPLAVCRARAASAAGGRRTSHQDPIHDAAARASALFRHLRKPARGAADQLRALPAERPARDLRSAGRAAAAVTQDQRQSLQGSQVAAALKVRLPLEESRWGRFESQHRKRSEATREPRGACLGAPDRFAFGRQRQTSFGGAAQWRSSCFGGVAARPSRMSPTLWRNHASRAS